MTERTKITVGASLKVGRIGYGSMRLTGPGLFGDYPDREAGRKFLREAVEAGVDLIDTADVYGPHTAETLIREALHPYPEHLVIATKGGLVRSGPELSTIGYIGNPQYLRQSAVLSARRLGVEQIDLYYLHTGRATDASFADQVGTLAELRKKGLIKNIGLSNVTVEQLREAREITDIAAVTAHYNVAARHEQPLLDAAVGGGAVFVPWQPVSLTAPGDSTDTSGPEAIAAVLSPIAEAHGATIPQVTLAWLLTRSPSVLPVPATTTIGHLRENLDAQDLVLTPEEISTIDALAQ
ncbi:MULTISPECIES: aldo/keto reductase [Streptomyces]|uniref:Oxidoreductase n=1 Tax=Streptomyces canarius TaxID=285453 RepID=A0ABQ3DC24_9ACTN|nr:aldo/keto reductase [Streptomyces canarius]GHA76604.1 oxidoreductase [Streptomyces canarius]